MLFTAGVALMAGASGAAQSFYPVKDGTLADGGVYGAFDGLADDADWFFNQSSYEGSISRSTGSPGMGLEHRVIWEYNLATLSLTPPVAATLHFTLRGATIFPSPDAVVHVYAYPADLQESLGDFSATPATLQGTVTVTPFQAPTSFAVNVSSAVGAALTSGARKVAFRFQIDPGTTHNANQAYIDALDSDATTKPRLVVEQAEIQPGDIDGDGDVDADDFVGFPPCMSGPNQPATGECGIYDFDQDSDVDLTDYQTFQGYL